MIQTALDADGNCFVGCFFEQSARFGNIILTNSVDTTYAALVKYDLDGNALWARQLYEGSTYFRLATDQAGNCYVGKDDNVELSFTKFDHDGILMWNRL